MRHKPQIILQSLISRFVFVFFFLKKHVVSQIKPYAGPSLATVQILLPYKKQQSKVDLAAMLGSASLIQSHILSLRTQESQLGSWSCSLWG